MRSRLRGRSTAIGLCILFTACERSPNAPLKEGNRLIYKDRLAVEWQHTIGADDTLFAVPTMLALGEKLVVVLDPMASRIVALSRVDGSAKWSFGKAGSGPGELRSPSSVVATRTGSFLVFDPPNSKVLELSSEGLLVRESSVNGVTSPRTACQMSDGRILISQTDLASPLVVLDSSFTRAGRVDFPWPIERPRIDNLQAGASLGEYVRTTQGVVASAGGSKCIFARQTEGGIALLDKTKTQWQTMGVDIPPIDSLRSNTSTTIAVAQTGDSVLVAFHGIGARRGKLIDVYSLNDGSYLGSLETPDRMSWLSADSLGLAVLKNTASGAVISLWTITAVTPDISR